MTIDIFKFGSSFIADNDCSDVARVVAEELGASLSKHDGIVIIPNGASSFMRVSRQSGDFSVDIADSLRYESYEIVLGRDSSREYIRAIIDSTVSLMLQGCNTSYSFVSIRSVRVEANDASSLRSVKMRLGFLHELDQKMWFSMKHLIPHDTGPCGIMQLRYCRDDAWMFLRNEQLLSVAYPVYERSSSNEQFEPLSVGGLERTAREIAAIHKARVARVLNDPDLDTAALKARQDFRKRTHTDQDDALLALPECTEMASAVGGLKSVKVPMKTVTLHDIWDDAKKTMREQRISRNAMRVYPVIKKDVMARTRREHDLSMAIERTQLPHEMTIHERVMPYRVKE